MYGWAGLFPFLFLNFEQGGPHCRLIRKKALYKREALPKPKHKKKKNCRCKLKDSCKARVGNLYIEGTHDVCLHYVYKPATWPLHRRDASKTFPFL
jgi:hypothetical protein